LRTVEIRGRAAGEADITYFVERKKNNDFGRVKSKDARARGMKRILATTRHEVLFWSIEGLFKDMVGA
jgi:hypothetical protein